MNRERLTILRDHLASLPDEQFDMGQWDCGTAACIGGWTVRLFPDGGVYAYERLGITRDQADVLFWLEGQRVGLWKAGPRVAALAIQSMLDSPDDDALPVWPEATTASARGDEEAQPRSAPQPTPMEGD